ncbi:hypothetical protein BOO71_0001162 [Deinococcus marmoris]|uniref:Uncharacterized protein n=1 Tax=Deinococcus marmoris TaxID=249408 RepID=A0A1U7P4A1_9DEIO|nr:hypothetical protein BOO71_0001162 [Deinococcus marmoris]
MRGQGRHGRHCIWGRSGWRVLDRQPNCRWMSKSRLRLPPPSQPLAVRAVPVPRKGGGAKSQAILFHASPEIDTETATEGRRARSGRAAVSVTEPGIRPEDHRPFPPITPDNPCPVQR